MRKNADDSSFRFHMPTDFTGVEVSSQYFTRAREAPRHVHQEYVFSLALEGVSRFYCGHCRETHIVKPGDLLLTEAHEVYAAEWDGEQKWSSISLSITKEKMLSVLEIAGDGQTARLPHYSRGAIRNGKLHRSFATLHNSLRQGGASSLERESLLFEWLSLIGKNYSASPEYFRGRRLYNETEAIKRTREFIHENLSENFDLQTLARNVRLSPFYLNRAFSAQVGLPPHEYQNQLRIRKSIELIRRKKSFSEIAFELGFSDQSHFNRFFKRYFGTTPQAFSRESKIVL